MISTERDAPTDRRAPGLFAGRYRWIICGLLFLATTILYIDRQILALLKGMLDQELHWTDTQFGLVMASFQATYGLGLLGFGWFVDRVGVKIGYGVTMGGSSAWAMFHALAGSVGGFTIARAGLGLSESGNFPSAIKAVAQWFPQKERALATAIFNAGACVGPVIAPAIIPFIAERWGWRADFLLLGALGFAWQGAWWLFYDRPESQKRLSTPELAYIESEAAVLVGVEKTPWRVLLKYRQTWAFVVAKLLTDPVWWFFLYWLPDYFKKTRGMDIQKSWSYLVAIYGLVTVLSLFGGWVTGHLVRKGWTVTRSRKTGLFFFALCVTPVYFATRTGNWGAVALIGLAGAAHQSWSANLFTTVSDMFPKRAVGSVVGLGGMAGAFGGVVFQIFPGWLLDHVPKATGYAILFGICGGAYLTAFVANHLLAPRFDPIVLE
jgi:ACS family hexuronate transporter-like MFS transporter